MQKRLFYQNKFTSIAAYKPRYILTIGLIFSVLIATSAYFELQQSRAELIQIHVDEGIALLETIRHSATTSLLSQVEIEDLMVERLFNNARAVREIERYHPLDMQFLQSFAEKNHLYRINIFDNNGKKILSSCIDEKHYEEGKHQPKEYFQSILDGSVEEIEIGLKSARLTEGKRYAVAVKRASRGVIVVNIDAEDMLAFRKRIGLGKLIENITNQPGLEYIVLQDDQGILAATPGVLEMTSLAADAFLQADSVQTRTVHYNNKEVLEVVCPFWIKNIDMGILRVGLHLDELRALERRMVRRAIGISLVIGFVGLILVGIVLINQNYALLHQEHERIKTYTGNILHAMTDVVIGVDKQTVITYVNTAACQLLRVDRDQIVGKLFVEYFPESILQILEKKQTLENSELSLRITPLNQTIFVSISISYVHDDSGEGDDIPVVLLRDLTRQKQLEDQLRRQEKLMAMGELASGVAHEIRNPLNAISMIVQRFQREFEPIEDADEYFSLARTVRSETKRINEIINQFLKFAKPPRLNKTRVPIDELITGCLNVISSQAHAQNVRMTTHIKTDVIVYVDRNQLHQAFLNVLQNSLESLSENDSGKITVSVSQLERDVIIEIDDTGSGISEAHLKRIFDLYFTTKTTGTGFGLPLVHRIITEHCGQIAVQSETGVGTLFSVVLPIKN
ncbi:MAG: hypothetical protein B6244_01970 [Candidatus Cloacimonetes bacterium 4572_55]|nr:MAG: hypothetical protein B6244_01970 [Candidatus Cloacimonetes bacterium 4572_55]